jgi:hypothetical protein
MISVSQGNNLLCTEGLQFDPGLNHLFIAVSSKPFSALWAAFSHVTSASELGTFWNDMCSATERSARRQAPVWAVLRILSTNLIAIQAHQSSN